MARIIAKFPRNSPGAWLAVAAGTTFAATIGAGWLLLDQIRFENARQDRLRLLGEVVGAFQQDGLADARALSRDIASESVGFLSGDTSQEELALAAIRAGARVAGADMAFVLDSSGIARMRFQAPGEPDIQGKDLSFRRYFQVGMRGKEDEFAALGAYTGSRGIYSSTPVRSRDGKRLGVAVCRLPASEIESRWLSRLEDPALLTTPEGVVIASNVPGFRLGSIGGQDSTIDRIRRSRQFGDSVHALPFDLRKTLATLEDKDYVVVRAEIQGGWTLASLLPGSSRLPLTPAQFGAAFGLGAAWSSLAVLALVAMASMHRIRQGEADRVRLSKRLEEAERLESLGRLAGGVAHDFNNVLTAIIGYASVLEYKLPADAPEKDLARRVGMAAKRAAETVRQLLAFARRSGLQSKPVSMHAILRELAASLPHTFPGNIRFRLETLAVRDIVIADPGHIQQSLLNLCHNSRDAMPEGGTITFSTSLVETGAGRMLELRISDTGAGIPPETLPHLFEPFYTTKQGARGTGLGLASVWGIIQKHGGNIAVESQPGKGTEFRIRLPLAPSGVEAERIGSAIVPPGDGRRLKIAALDDDRDVLHVIDTILKALGHEVSIHEEFGSLWTSLQEGRIPDLLVLDLDLPGTNGVEALRKIRVAHPGMPVVAASGRLSGAVMDELRGLGVETFLRKPFGAQDFGSAIGKVFGDGRR